MTKHLPTSEAEKLRCGDIVVVPFPFSDKLAEKRRPALVVSGDLLSQEGMVWLVMITSARKTKGAHDCAIPDPFACGLNVACVVRPTKMTGVEPTRILRRTGRLGARETNVVLASVRAFIGKEIAVASPKSKSVVKKSKTKAAQDT